MPGPAEDSHSALGSLFEQMDTERRGALDREGVKAVAEKLFDPKGRREVTEDELDYIMEVADPSGQGQVPFAEFAAWWANLGWQVQKQQAQEEGTTPVEPVRGVEPDPLQPATRWLRLTTRWCCL